MANFNVGKDAKTVNVHLKLSLRVGVKNKSLKQSKGTGASGTFKIGEVVKPKKKPAAKPKKAAKPKAAKPKKAKTPKKTAGICKGVVLVSMYIFNLFDFFLFSVFEKREKIWHRDKAGYRFVNCEITI
jgi:hypothetical protein